MCFQNFMKFRYCLFKILKNQNVADGQMDGGMNGHQNRIPPNKHNTPQQTVFVGGWVWDCIKSCLVEDNARNISVNVLSKKMR